MRSPYGGTMQAGLLPSTARMLTKLRKKSFLLAFGSGLFPQLVTHGGSKAASLPYQRFRPLKRISL